MDPQIHGAIGGGAIGGATVVLGLGVEWWVTRLRDRRADVEAAAAELAMLLPHVLVPISEVWTKDRPETDAGGSWVAKRENVERLLVTIIRRARRPMRHAKKIRAAARLTHAKFIALTYEWQTRRRPVEQDELYDIWTADLTGLVFGKSEPLDNLIDEQVARIRNPQASRGSAGSTRDPGLS
jgi:hypothetical protein